MAPYLFRSESVASGHPDKISDATLDACLEEDPNARVACEVMVSSGLVIIVGEITIENLPIISRSQERPSVKLDTTTALLDSITAHAECFSQSIDNHPKLQKG